MLVVDNLTEQTTSATDAVLMVITLLGIYSLYRVRNGDRWKARIWTLALACLAICALGGALLHGLVLSDGPHEVLRHIVDAGLGLTVCLAFSGAVYDGWGQAPARRVIPVVVGVGAVIFVITLFLPATFLVFALYEGVAMLVALITYARLAVLRRLSGAGLMVIGIIAMIASAVVQPSDAAVMLILPFDHNGLFHVLQTVGVVFLVLGVYAALTRVARPMVGAAGR